NPDIILITGDLVDSRRFNLEIAMDFINGAVNIAPVYYVSGNHEARLSQYPNIKSQLADAGVNVLDNQKISIEINNNYIDILGLSDPNFFNNKNEFEQYLKEWSESESFKVLLSHRPELFDLYVKYNMDLTFSGHAHGGQIRLPFIGAMVAPNQGLLPKYTSGFYTQENSTMFVSRGIGNSIIPLRVLNRPEIAFITLSK
ncbi:MAG: metallophosphoesterase, partial [Anaerotignaceae bacterium]